LTEFLDQQFRTSRAMRDVAIRASHLPARSGWVEIAVSLRTLLFVASEARLQAGWFSSWTDRPWHAPWWQDATSKIGAFVLATRPVIAQAESVVWQVMQDAFCHFCFSRRERAGGTLSLGSKKGCPVTLRPFIPVAFGAFRLSPCLLGSWSAGIALTPCLSDR